MSKYLYILDSGHGGVDPSTGKYVTAGKRMVKDGITFYEGVNNRDNVKRIMAGMKKEGLECIDIVNDWRDISLTERVIRANKIAKDRKCVYISIHSDANGNGKEWNSASGIGTYVYDKGSKSSNDLAKYMHQELVCNFDGLAKDRKIKKCAFYVHINKASKHTEKAIDKGAIFTASNDNLYVNDTIITERIIKRGDTVYIERIKTIEKIVTRNGEIRYISKKDKRVEVRVKKKAIKREYKLNRSKEKTKRVESRISKRKYIKWFILFILAVIITLFIYEKKRRKK